MSWGLHGCHSAMIRLLVSVKTTWRTWVNVSHKCISAHNIIVKRYRPMPGTFSPPPTSKEAASDLGMHHGTCVTHVAWCMSGSLTCGSRENDPGIPGACAICDFTYLRRGPYNHMLIFSDILYWWKKYTRCIHYIVNAWQFEARLGACYVSTTKGRFSDCFSTYLCFLMCTHRYSYQPVIHTLSKWGLFCCGVTICPLLCQFLNNLAVARSQISVVP